MNIKALLLSILLTNLGFITSVHADDKSDAQSAIENAQSLWDQSIAVGHEWNTIKPLIAQAKQALQENDFAKAIALAKEASAQSKHAIIQAELEQTNWVNNLPK
ncbi:MAG TPA: hypothetical protein EYQ47_00615 [Cycloclasticus sp.]|jgi:hypothetical protein|nr:hypothetical protein [Cycloclasticus sp.]